MNAGFMIGLYVTVVLVVLPVVWRARKAPEPDEGSRYMTQLISAHQIFEDILSRKGDSPAEVLRLWCEALEGFTDEERAAASEAIDMMLENLQWRRLLSGDGLARLSAQGITDLAALIAGLRRRPGLRAEWRSHLAGETGQGLSRRQKARGAFGFLLGALKMRMRDLGDLAWMPADRVLGSRVLSNLFVLVPTVVVAMIIFLDAGTLGLMESMASIAATWAALYGLISCGRWWRDVKPPEPKPRTKD